MKCKNILPYVILLLASCKKSDPGTPAPEAPKKVMVTTLLFGQNMSGIAIGGQGEIYIDDRSRGSPGQECGGRRMEDRAMNNRVRKISFIPQ
jgi:hypothetical protein